MTPRSFGSAGFDLRNAAQKLAVAMLIASVLCALSGMYGRVYLLFTPGLVIDELFVWQLFTSIFIAGNPMEVIFGFIIILMCGTSLVYHWGEKRFLQVAIGIPLVSMFLTLVLSFILPTIQAVPYSGAQVMITVIWIAYGLVAWSQGMMLNFWGLPLNGLNFAYLGVGFAVLNGVFFSFYIVIPDLIAAGLTFLYFRRRRQTEGFFQRIELWYYNWKLRRLKAKRGLRVVEGEGKKSPTDRQLH